MEEQKRTCFEKLIERLLEKLLEKLFERLIEKLIERLNEKLIERLFERLLKALEKPLPTPIVKKHAFLCVSNKLLYFCKRKELLDKQTYVYCRNRNRC